MRCIHVILNLHDEAVFRCLRDPEISEVYTGNNGLTVNAVNVNLWAEETLES